MALQTSHKWIIVIGSIIAIGVIAYFVYKANSKPSGPSVPPSSTTTTTPGILDTVQTQFCKLFPKSKLCGGKSSPTKYCDCERPGYAMDGTEDSNCKEGHLFYDQDCA